MTAVLRLPPAELSVLAAVPVLCFGLFSGTAAPLARRFGEERVLGAALVTLAAGLLLRSAAPGVLLFPGTIVAGGSIAVMNVLLGSLIKRRRPEHAGLLIGLYLAALAAGAIAGSVVAVPLFNATGQSHGAARLALGLWAVPAVLAAVVWLPQLRFRSLPGPPQPLAPAGVPAPPPPGRPPPGGPPSGRTAQRGSGGVLSMARYPLAWQVMTFLGLQSLVYYAALSWFPTMFRARGASAVHAGDLLALMNLGNAVTALLLPVLAHRAKDQRVLVAASVVATAAGLAGAQFAPLSTAAGWCLLLGLGQGATLGLGIFLTMARAPDPLTAASLSGFAQGAGYMLASTGPLLLGVLHTATGGWTVPVWALLGAALAELAAGWLAGRALTVPAAAAVTPSDHDL